MIDAYTDTWRAIAAKANEVIDAGHHRLEQYDQSYGESQFIRGQLYAMREILSLIKPAVISNPQQPQELRPRDRSGV